MKQNPLQARKNDDCTMLEKILLHWATLGNFPLNRADNCEQETRFIISVEYFKQ